MLSCTHLQELEVLKAILVREGYLQRLAHASASGRISGAHLGETVDLLDLLRIATLEAVEAIGVWRIKTKRLLDPYVWNSVNYLLKLPSDVDFLQKHTGLVQWLGFTLERNPFVLPLNLDCQARLGSRSGSHTPHAGAQPAGPHDSSRFIEVGGKRRLDVALDGSDRPVSPSKAAAHAAALAERKRAKNPYETRIVNDEELLPLNGRSGERSAATPAIDKGARPKTRAATASLVLPSQIGELDMSRIRDAEAVILQEEARCGRFTRDAQGRIVPEDEARRRSNMVAFSGDAYASVLPHTSPQSAGDVTREREERHEDDLNHVEPRSQSQSLAGKLQAKKRAALLGPISKPSTSVTVLTSEYCRSITDACDFGRLSAQARASRSAQALARRAARRSARARAASECAVRHRH